MDSENRAYLGTISITLYKNICFGCVKETSPLTQNISLIGKH